MKQLFPRGKRIRPTDKDLVFHTALAALFPVFLLVVLRYNRTLLTARWQGRKPESYVPVLWILNHRYAP